mmetsp:Transcript_7750/g.25369  ORF Transcript_7750/g.25369 Transcript_7750/m.25369 type:complete len:389 (+) Transcript_7750:2893-4059(+)
MFWASKRAERVDDRRVARAARRREPRQLDQNPRDAPRLGIRVPRGVREVRFERQQCDVTQGRHGRSRRIRTGRRRRRAHRLEADGGGVLWHSQGPQQDLRLQRHATDGNDSTPPLATLLSCLGADSRKRRCRLRDALRDRGRTGRRRGRFAGFGLREMDLRVVPTHGCGRDRDAVGHALQLLLGDVSELAGRRARELERDRGDREQHGADPEEDHDHGEDGPLEEVPRLPGLLLHLLRDEYHQAHEEDDDDLGLSELGDGVVRILDVRSRVRVDFGADEGDQQSGRDLRRRARIDEDEERGHAQLPEEVRDDEEIAAGLVFLEEERQVGYRLVPLSELQLRGLSLHQPDGLRARLVRRLRQAERPRRHPPQGEVLERRRAMRPVELAR